jgi:hypothetical protein
MENSADIINIAATVRQFKGVTEIKMQKETELDYIPGLPYTYEERMTDIRNAEENYAMGQTATLKELKKRIAAW